MPVCIYILYTNAYIGMSLMQTHTIRYNPPKKKMCAKKRTRKNYFKISASKNNSNNANVGKKRHTHTHTTQSARYGCFVCGLSSYPSIDVCVYLLFGNQKRETLMQRKTRNGRYRTCNPEHEKDCSSIYKKKRNKNNNNNNIVARN